MDSRLYTSSSRAYTGVREARLLGSVGYALSLDATGIPNTCNIDVLPGAIIPKWGVRDGCRAAAQVVEPAPELGINGDGVVIYSCAIDVQWFWIWYNIKTKPQTPITFMQAGADISQGTGLSLADYTKVVLNGQTPDSGVDSTMLSIPPVSSGCPNRPVQPKYPKGCNTCHMPF